MRGKNEPTTLHSLYWKIPGYNVSAVSQYRCLLCYEKSDQAKFRLTVIEFFAEFGLKPTLKAFQVSKATIYRWRKRLKDSGGRLDSLIPQSTAPKNKRQMMVEPAVISYISQLRKEHPRLGKRKIKPLLEKYCRKEGLTSISESTIGKVIKRFNLTFSPPTYGRAYHNPNSAWARKKLKKKKRQRVKYSPKPKDFGYLEIDTIIRFDQGMKLYVYNAIDIKLRFQFSLAYKRASSKNTVNFFQRLEQIYPLKQGIKIVQTDNGSEYLGAFDQYLTKKRIKHLFIYPRCPKINGYVERANRALQKEFINWNIDLALTDINLFNRELIDYLIWYNTIRPHEGLNDQSPIDYLLKIAPESQKYVTCTLS